MTRFGFELAFGPYSIPTTDDDADDEMEDGDEDEEEEEVESESVFDGDLIQSPPISVEKRGKERKNEQTEEQRQQQFSLSTFMVAALRKSLVTCAVDPEEDVCRSMDIGWPTDVRHIAHVTFDRFNGFLGLPVDLEPEVPTRVPSASINVFGVSPGSMQCSYDSRGNSVPTILLLMQKHLYSQGGLQTEGIFRINAENSHQVHVREQLNKGIIPQTVDSHCLASLIKAWFRELPTGVLDCLSPDQVMRCSREEGCSHLVSLLPPVEAALLNWAINLMADVVEHECENKMNARNIAMVFAPNMTQMDDPLTALMHAVRVMNFLKALVIITLKERRDLAAEAAVLKSSFFIPSSFRDDDDVSSSTRTPAGRTSDEGTGARMEVQESSPICEEESQSELGESFHSFEDKNEIDEESMFVSGFFSLPIISDNGKDSNTCNVGHGDGYGGLFDRLSFRKGVRKFSWHPVFQFTRSFKKSTDLATGSSDFGKTSDNLVMRRNA